MKEYQVSELTGNEILAKPVYLENGNLILEIGTVLKPSYKESLISLDIEKIYVEDFYEKYERSNYYFERKQLLDLIAQLRKIMSHHIYKENQRLKGLKNLAERIVDLFEKIEEHRVLDMKIRTYDLYEHSIYTALLVLLLGKEYQFSTERMRNAALGCLLHDLGHRYMSLNTETCIEKSMIPISVLEIKKHTILGYSAVEKEEWIPNISKRMILSHHEKLDGSGYPLRQKKHSTECKMIQVCDCFDCAISGMKNNRFSVSEAFDLISDTEKYDRKMVKFLKKKIGMFPTGTFVKLSNHKTAVVVSQTENPLAPIVLYTDPFDENEPIEENLNYQKKIRIIEVL